MDTRQAVAELDSLDDLCGPFGPSEGEDIQGNQQGGQLRRWPPVWPLVGAGGVIGTAAPP
jgi:hypothetical protein